MTENILGRKLEDIDVSFLRKFFEEDRIEGDLLELKSYYDKEGDIKGDNFKEKQRKVLKTICAFLNSSGGILIWGAPIGKPKDQVKVFSGDLSPVPILIEKDSFINMISDKTVPLPSSVKFASIEVEPSKFVYLIEVSESITKPHQYDHSYYMRLDGQTREAPHHYIEALFKQVKFPEIEGYIRIDDLKIESRPTTQRQGQPIYVNIYILTISIILVNFSPLQNEENVSYRVHCSMGQFSNYAHNLIIMKGAQEIREENAISVLSNGQPFITSLKIEFREDKIRDVNYITPLLLSFGGRFAPHKISFYRIDLSKKDISNTFNELFIEISENKSGYEKQLELGTTRGSFLNLFLGR